MESKREYESQIGEKSKLIVQLERRLELRDSEKIEILQRSEDLEAECTQLKERVTELNDSYQKMIDDGDALEKENVLLQKKILQLQKSKTPHGNPADVFTEMEKEALLRENEEFKASISLLEQIKTNLELEVSQLEESRTRIEETASKLKSDLECASSELVMLRSQVSEVSLESKDQENILRLESQISELESMRTDSDARFSELKELYENQEHRIAELNQALIDKEDLIASLQSRTSPNEDLSQEVEILRNKLSIVEKSSCDVIQELDQLRAMMMEKDTEISRLSREIEENQNFIQEFNSLVTEKSHLDTNLKLALENLASALETQKDLEARNSEVHQESEKLQSELASLTDQHQKLLNYLEERKAVDAEKEVKSSGSIEGDPESDLHSKKPNAVKVKELAKAFKKLKQEKEDLVRRIEVLDEDKVKLTSLVERTESQIKEKDVRISELSFEITSLVSQVHELKKKNETVVPSSQVTRKDGSITPKALVVQSMVKPAPSAASASLQPDSEVLDDDLSFETSKKKAAGNEFHSSLGSAGNGAAAAEAKSSSSFFSFLSRMFSKEKKTIKQADLTEDTEFYFDPATKKWIDKKNPGGSSSSGPVAPPPKKVAPSSDSSSASAPPGPGARASRSKKVRPKYANAFGDVVSDSKSTSHLQTMPPKAIKPVLRSEAVSEQSEKDAYRDRKSDLSLSSESVSKKPVQSFLELTPASLTSVDLSRSAVSVEASETVSSPLMSDLSAVPLSVLTLDQNDAVQFARQVVSLADELDGILNNLENAKADNSSKNDLSIKVSFNGFCM